MPNLVVIPDFLWEKFWQQSGWREGGRDNETFLETFYRSAVTSHAARIDHQKIDIIAKR